MSVSLPLERSQQLENTYFKNLSDLNECLEECGKSADRSHLVDRISQNHNADSVLSIYFIFSIVIENSLDSNLNSLNRLKGNVNSLLNRKVIKIKKPDESSYDAFMLLLKNLSE